MKSSFLSLVLLGIFVTTTAFAQAPIISRNVHVVHNATPSQCPSTWNSKGASENVGVVYDTGGGQYNAVNPGIDSCVNCAIDSKSQDCVCGTCYSYYNPGTL